MISIKSRGQHRHACKTMHWSIIPSSKLVFLIPVATAVAHPLQWIITSPAGNTTAGTSVYWTNVWLRVMKWMWSKRKCGRTANRSIKAPLTVYMGQQGNCGERWNSPLLKSWRYYYIDCYLPWYDWLGQIVKHRSFLHILNIEYLS